MKSLPTSIRANIFIFSESGLLLDRLHPRLVSREVYYGQSYQGEPHRKGNVKLGHPSKLSSLDKRRIVSSVTTGRADNAVQATPLINPPSRG